MMRSEGVSSILRTKTESQTLEKVIDKLVSISDVNGAAILRTDGSVISYSMKDDSESTQDMDVIIGLASAKYQKNIHYYKNGMFTESILSCNGHKVLISRINEDLMLLLLLDRRAYLGLTMLDIKGCLRDVDKALSECFLQPRNNPD